MDNVDMGTPGADRSVIQVLATLPGNEVATDSKAMYDLIVADGAVRDEADRVARLERLSRIKGKQGQLTGARDRLLKPFKDGVEGIRNFFRAPIDYLEKAEALEKSRLIEWDRKVERQRQEQQEAAFRAAENERKRLERAAQRADQKGDVDRAQQLQAQAMTTVAPVIESPSEKVTGAVMREVWTFEITDPALIPRQWLKVDEQKIRRQVNATRAETSIPGVRVFKERSLAVRSRE